MGRCECGCGSEVKNRFVSGHNKNRFRVRRNPHSTDITYEDRGYKTLCHIWQHGLNGVGYGDRSPRPTDLGMTRLVHKQNWEERNGIVPDGLELDHLCGIRQCCNPDHLEPVSHTVNVRRGRKAKLTEEAVREAIARCIAGETRKSVAAHFGVDPSTISEAVRGLLWSGVGSPVKRNDQKLTWANVFEIHLRSILGERQLSIAARFGIHYVHVGSIVNNKAWKLPEVA